MSIDITEFNRRYLTTLIKSISLSRHDAMITYDLSADQICALISAQNKTINLLSEAKLFIVEPKMNIHYFNEYLGRGLNETSDVSSLNYSYLLSIRNLAAGNIRLAALKTRMTLDCCEKIHKISLGQLYRIACSNSILFKLGISARTLSKANTSILSDTSDQKSQSFISHVPIMSISSSTVIGNIR